MMKKTSKFWKVLSITLGTLLGGVIAYYIYRQQNPKYDPWEEPWENSSSPIDLGLDKDEKQSSDDDQDGQSGKETPEE
ncbi:MAG: hypothetical protein J5965_22515 [Aeriscardovia sp.]|nr:hypothetical protein [Aeriscardovia sp.]MBR4413904.1 hypothetical protein [Aeriscardovia sp.]